MQAEAIGVGECNRLTAFSNPDMINCAGAGLFTTRSLSTSLSVSLAPAWNLVRIERTRLRERRVNLA
jgi:hypothetical protein